MGHREDLLAGAKRCLYEKGYARTTARDIVAASGANLASIGYHFGSKEALLTAALIEAFDELDTQLEAVTFPPGGFTSSTQVEAAFQRQIEQWAAHRPLVVAHLEAMAQARHLPEVRAQLATSYERYREVGVRQVLAMTGGRLDAQTARAVVSHQMALTDGMMLQHLFDPDRAPTPRDIVVAARALADFFHSFDDTPTPVARRENSR